MNGKLNLMMWGGRHFVVAGGAYTRMPKGYRGVKMAEEIHAACTVDIPTPDFNVPAKDVLDVGLAKAVDMILKGQPVYVGCMAGRGRTGLFLAILAKAFGAVEPVLYVRKHYYAHAVETPGQYKFVDRYKIPYLVQLKINLAKCMSLLKPEGNLTKST